MLKAKTAVNEVNEADAYSKTNCTCAVGAVCDCIIPSVKVIVIEGLVKVSVRVYVDPSTQPEVKATTPADVTVELQIIDAPPEVSVGNGDTGLNATLFE